MLSLNLSESPNFAIAMTWPRLLLGTPAGTFPSFRPLHEHGGRRVLRWRLRAWYFSG